MADVVFVEDVKPSLMGLPADGKDTNDEGRPLVSKTLESCRGGVIRLLKANPRACAHLLPSG